MSLRKILAEEGLRVEGSSPSGTLNPAEKALINAYKWGHIPWKKLTEKILPSRLEAFGIREQR